MAHPILSDNQPIVTRDAAQEAGEKYYFTGKACKQGHISLRAVTDCRCVVCARARKYWPDSGRHKVWGERNPGKVTASRARWYQKHKKEIEAKRIARMLATPYLGSKLPPRPANCEVCSAETKLYRDHCHNALRFRGWLCHGCNAALGFAKDSPQTLRALADYLERGGNHPAQ